MAAILIDTIPFVSLTLTESADSAKKGKMIVRGEFARSDKATENKRLYREHLWRREIGRLGEAMQNRRAFGELDHPADGRTKLQRVSHLLTSLKVEGNSIEGEAEILDTPNGRILRTLAEAGAQVGVSSRGFGSTKTTPEGVEEVQEDFRLDTFDFVADPATKTAYPKVFHEELQRIPEEDMGLTMDDLRRNYPGLVEEMTRGAVLDVESRVESRLKDRFAAELRRQVEQISEAAEIRVRSELRSDPDVAGAKQILERIASMVYSFGSPVEQQQEMEGKDNEIKRLKDQLAERELEIQAAKAEGKQLGLLAKEAAYRLHMERKLTGMKARDAIVKLIGDVMQYESTDVLDSRIEAVSKELAQAKDEHIGEEGEAKDVLLGRIQELESRVEKAEERSSEATEKVREANERTRKAIEIAEKAQVEGFVNGIAEGHADGDTLRSLCESADSVEEARRIVARFGARKVSRTIDEDEAQRIRARVSKGKERSLEEDTFGGHQARTRGKDNGRPRGLLGDIGLDLTETEFDELAGTKGLTS